MTHLRIALKQIIDKGLFRLEPELDSNRYNVEKGPRSIDRYLEGGK